MNEHAQFMADDAVIESADDLSELGQAALYYANLGMKVFPCARGDKRPAGWLVSNGQHDATADAAKITEWWRKEPNANIGLYLKGSGLVAVDPDLYKRECQWTAFVSDKAIPPTWTQKSPRGGRHYIFHAADGADYGGKLCEGVDIKHDGYVLLAPSVVGGKSYEIESSGQIAPAPDWLPMRGQVNDTSLAFPQNFTVNGERVIGDRSEAFHGVVGKMKDAGLSIDMAEAALRRDPYSTGAIKYLEGGRDYLRREIERSWRKLSPAPQGGETKRAIRWLDFGEVESKPPVWLVDGFIEQSCMVILFGEPGSAKSFLALDWALCIATGTPWLDRDVEQGQVTYIAGEGHSGLFLRRDAWFRQRGIANPGRDLPFKLSGHAVDVPEACDVLLEDLAALSVPPSLIVIDTLNRNFGGGNENDTKDMTAFTHAVDRIRTAFPQAAVVVVHHTGLAEKHRERGSNSLRAASEAAYRMDIAPEKDGTKHFALVNVRMKDGPAPDPVHLKLEDVRFSGETGSAVLMPGDAPSQPTGGSKINGTTQAALNALIEAARSSGVRGEDGRYWVPEKAWRDAFYEAQGDIKTPTKNKNLNRAKTDLGTLRRAVAEGDGYRLDHATSLSVASPRVINT